MIRSIAAAVLGYFVMAILAMASIAIVWFSLGSQFAFAENSTRASTGWSIAILLGGLIAAIAGGFVARFVGGSQGRRAVIILTSLVGILGIANFVMQWNRQPPPLPLDKTVHELTFMEAGECAVSPVWYNVAIVIVGMAGAWLGGRRRSSENP